MEETKVKKHGHSIMTKNVTQFRHLIKNPHATQNDVTWVINLRQYDTNHPPISKQGMAPQVYHKKTQLSQIRQKQFQKSKQKGFIPFKCSQYSHMVPKFNQKTLKHSESAIQFFSSLRQSNFTSKQKQNQPQFSCIPFKQRNQTPKVLKKAFIKKTDKIVQQDLQSALDGRQNFPHYSQKILRTKNYALLKGFTEVRGRGKVTLPGLAWQIGLRNY